MEKDMDTRITVLEGKVQRLMGLVEGYDQVTRMCLDEVRWAQAAIEELDKACLLPTGTMGRVQQRVELYRLEDKLHEMVSMESDVKDNPILASQVQARVSYALAEIEQAKAILGDSDGGIS